MDKKELIRQNTEQGMKLLCAELIIKIHNDILTKSWYEYYIKHNVKFRDKFSKRKLRSHFEAISWFMKGRENNIWMSYVKLNNLSDKAMLRIILKKFNSEKKFIKVMER